MERSNMILRRAIHAWLAVVRRERSLGGLLSSSRILCTFWTALAQRFVRTFSGLGGRVETCAGHRGRCNLHPLSIMTNVWIG